MRPVLVLLLTALPSIAGAQAFTTAAEVRPILQATRASWVALREWEGQDLLYFTHLESWRCGLGEVRYAVNGGAEQVWVMDPCFEGSAQPNAIAAERLPYTGFALGSVQSVSISLTYDDGTEERADYTRAAILMP